jgi:type I restriction enzyme S subunit
VTTSQPLGAVADIVRGISFPKEAKSPAPRDGDIACLRTTNVQRDVEWDDLWFVPAEHVKRTEQFVQPGDILISTANSYELVGKVALVRTMPRQATLGAFISLIRPRQGVDPKYLYHQLAWGRTQSRIRETASTTTNISNVSTKKLAALEVDLPPLDEQRRIVAEIEKQLSRLDEAVANLKRVKANLKRYKASVLADAVRGKISRSGDRWTQALLGEIASSVRNGISKKPDADSGIRILRISAVRPLMLDPGDVRYLPGPLNEYESFRIDPGDVLFTRYNGSVDLVGVCALVPQLVQPTVYPDKLIRVRLPRDVLMPEFLVIAASTGDARAFIQSRIRTTAGQAGVSGADIKALPLRIPPLLEQRRIVAEVDRRLSILREVELEVEQSMLRGSVLRQSALHSAFTRGQQPHYTVATSSQG